MAIREVKADEYQVYSIQADTERTLDKNLDSKSNMLLRNNSWKPFPDVGLKPSQTKG